MDAEAGSVLRSDVRNQRGDLMYSDAYLRWWLNHWYLAAGLLVGVAVSEFLKWRDHRRWRAFIEQAKQRQSEGTK